MKVLKRRVTAFFNRRRRALETLSGKGIVRPDDFFELYVLVRLVYQAGGGKLRNIAPSRHRQRPGFLVAAAPSGDWNNASFVELAIGSKQLAARTGLEVVTTPGTVELDVVVIDHSLVPVTGGVPSSAVEAAVECKKYKHHKVSGPQANEVIGKAVRVWARFPVPKANRGGGNTERFAVACTGGFTAPSLLVLDTYGIRPIHALHDIDRFLRDLLTDI